MKCNRIKYLNRKVLTKKHRPRSRPFNTILFRRWFFKINKLQLNQEEIHTNWQVLCKPSVENLKYLRIYFGIAENN